MSVQPDGTSEILSDSQKDEDVVGAGWEYQTVPRLHDVRFAQHELQLVDTVLNNLPTCINEQMLSS